jgi:hypothetical protein
VLVHLDVVRLRETVMEKRFFGLIKRETEQRYYDKLVLNALYRYAFKSGVSLEVFSPEASEKDMDLIMDELDKTGVNPFRRARIAPTLRDVVTSLPMEPNTLGVIDLPERGLVYGSWWIDRLTI